MTKIITNSDQETFAFGLKLGRLCRGGEVFALCGDLGAGKTRLVQGLAQGLSIKSRITSPTFNILKVYKVSKKIRSFYHIDAYRLRSEKDLIALGAQEFFSLPDAVIAIEWAERVKKIWPKEARVIKIRPLSETRREIIYS